MKTKEIKTTVSPKATEINSSDNFEIELHWCIQRLEELIQNKQISHGQREVTFKKIKQLRSSSVSMPKKRLIMKTTLGNYREQMRNEEKSFKLNSNQIKFSEKTDSDKHTFIKKAVLREKCNRDGTSINSTLITKEGFKFNFDIDSVANDIEKLAI